jgi:3-oxoacyl-[acyl-carrier-protein] synthase-1
MGIAITGLGIISSIGNCVEENLTSLLSGTTGIKHNTEIDKRKPRLLGQISLSNEELKGLFNTKEEHSRTALIGMKAASEAWGKSKPSTALKTGIISGTTIGGMDLTESVYADFKSNEKWSNLHLLAQHDNGVSTDNIADLLGINDYRTTVSTACSSAANAIMMGAKMIENGTLDRVLVGGTDALTAFTINGFDSLMIFDTEWCKPFDENRQGLNLGEGAAYILLENEKSIALNNSSILAKVTGWNNTADAYHQTASSPDGFGATEAMKKAIIQAKLEPNQIDYVNAHGTGTNNNDLSESTALINVFGENVPDFSSTKSYTGHTLAAAGGLEAVFSVLALQNDVIFPNLNFTNVIPEKGLVPNTQNKNKKVTHILSNSFGFGGNNTSLVFSKV